MLLSKRSWSRTPRAARAADFFAGIISSRRCSGPPRYLPLAKISAQSGNCRADAEIARRRGAAVLLLKPAQPVAVARQHPGRVVARAVVDHDQLEVLKALAENAVEGLRQKPRAIVSRDDNRDGRAWVHDQSDFSSARPGRNLPTT